MVVNLPEHGFHLRFEARSQCLRLIEVHDPTRVHCRYNGALVDGGASAVTLQRVSALFGPTFPGEMCAERGLVALHYPGLTFLFVGVTTAHAHGQAARIVLCAPAAHAGGTHARLDAVLAAAPPAPPAGAPPPLRVMLGVGLRVGHAGGALPFGCSPQDLVAELGPPSASMVKGSDAMLIHALPGQLQASGTGDYFLTWWDRGLDVLVDGEARRQQCMHARCAALTLLLRADAPREEVRAAHQLGVPPRIWRLHQGELCSGDAARSDAGRRRALGGTRRAAACARCTR